VARGGGFAHHYIAHSIGFNFDIVAMSPIHQKSEHLVEVMGGARHFSDFVEALPD
jgi:hypothetical protein